MKRIFAISLIFVTGSSAESLPERVTFNKDVRSILSDNCFACHGFDENTREAGLRLDTPEGAYADNHGVRSVVKGDPGASALIERIFEEDPDEIMPPPNSHKTLTDDQKAVLKKWIEQGAEYEDHWAWIAPVSQPIPADVKGREIDYFIRTALEKDGIKASPPAEKWRLVRRLYLDVIGLPPSAEELKRGLEMDTAALVDELLASPHFGERMAIPWLDLVRYADTVGYHGDQPVSVSPYRDYVINAFNANMPFDQFTREQIAGDLLPNATQSQKVASGYNRLNMTTEEGGSQPQEFLAKYSADRVRTTSTVWMGATLGCAECHDHKFDPYTTKDFYSMAAFFADIEEIGVYGNRGRPPEMLVTDPAQEKEIAAIDLEIGAKNAAIEKADVSGGLEKWRSEVLVALEGSEPFDFVWIDDDENAPGGKISGAWTGVTAADSPVFSGSKSWKQQSGAMVQHFFNMAKEPVTVAAGDRLFAYVWMDPKDPPKSLMLQAHSQSKGTWEHRGFWGEDRITYGGTGTNEANHRAMGDLPKAGEWVRLELPVEEIGFVAGDKIDGISFDQFGGLVYWDKAGIWTASGDLRTKSLPADVLAALNVTDKAEVLANYYRGIAPELQPLRDEVAALMAKRETFKNSGRMTLVTVSTKPRMTRVLARGNWMDESGAEVLPAVPEFLGKVSGEGERKSRLDLANWLVAERNPLTSRVFVNRLWKQFFGTGISKGLDDVGVQGEWPRHPALLDWLALEFVRSGWDVKHMVRTIVLSDTYQQKSHPRTELKDSDPFNRRLARQSSYRLEAELVRDSALSISGLLVEKTGGESVNPYQPANYYQHLNFPRREYQPDMGENQWRRGVYTHWQRTFLHPMMKSFDAPSREECTANRPMSNTPLQALVLLNDPTYLECARVFAGRVLTEGGGDFEARLRWAFKEALSREPSAEEITEVRALFDKHLLKFQADTEAAKAYVSVGIAPAISGVDAAEHAAWTSVSRVIFNLHEMIARY